MSRVEFSLARYQDDFINSDKKKVAIVGAKGSSKTWTGARFTLSEVVRQPNEQHLIMLNTLQQARDVFYQDIEPLLQQLSWPYHLNPQTMVLRVWQTRVHLRSAERDAIKKIESISYASGWADEASYYDPESFDTFRSRIRKGEHRVRVTSMPDEPDHWLYEKLERGGFELYEISLYDNPDKEFVKINEDIIKSTYHGAQLKRYLSGERVSLQGTGLFCVEPDQKEKINPDPGSDILLVWDFNVSYRAVTAIQKIGRDEESRPIIGFVKSWQMKEATVYEDAEVLAKELQKMGFEKVLLSGDASENKRSSQTTESIWMTVRRGLKDAGMEVRNKVPKSNPNVKDTIQCANWSLRQGLVRFAKDEKNVYRSLQAAKADRYGEIDKSGDDSPGGAKSHEADVARYGMWHFYKKLYPGGRNKTFVAT